MHNSICRIHRAHIHTHLFTHSHTCLCSNGKIFEIYYNFTFDDNNKHPIALRLLWKFFVCVWLWLTVFIHCLFTLSARLIVSILKLRDIVFFYFLSNSICILENERCCAYRAHFDNLSNDSCSK